MTGSLKDNVDVVTVLHGSFMCDVSLTFIRHDLLGAVPRSTITWKRLLCFHDSPVHVTFLVRVARIMCVTPSCFYD